jgi:xanthine dehydrogenase/oxidase
MFFAESIIDHIAKELGIDSNVVRVKNFYSNGQITHYNQLVSNFTVKDCWNEVLERSNHTLKFNEIVEFNRYAILISCVYIYIDIYILGPIAKT